MKNNGFTLIELMIIVAIIGILASISIQTYLSLKKTAIDKSAQTDVKNLITSVTASSIN